MTIFIKEMTLLCSIYDVELWPYVKRHELVNGENGTGKMNFFLADPLYIVRRDRDDDYAEYDIFVSNDMNDTENVFGYVMKPGACVHVFRFALQYFLFSKAPASKK